MRSALMEIGWKARMWLLKKLNAVHKPYYDDAVDALSSPTQGEKQ